MQIISFEFYIFAIISIVLYYSLFKKYQWQFLLFISLIFFIFSSGIHLTLLFLLICFLAQCGSIAIEETKLNKHKNTILIFTIILIIIQIGIFKYLNFFVITFNHFSKIIDYNKNFSLIHIMAPIGISYYTLAMIGYVLDVYWGKCKAQKNYFKLLLYFGYFPILTSGPILKYDISKSFYETHKYNWNNIIRGFELALWGLFKKIVVADNIAPFVNTIYNDYSEFTGWYLIIATLTFSLQLYADFSGCINIIQGLSECFGIILPDNFKEPFSSKTVAEFWRRWHISMGEWFKEYLLYPILKSDLMQSFSKKIKHKYSKKIANKICTYIGLFVIWIIIGIWHGGYYKYIISSGLIPGFFLIMGDLLTPVFDRAKSILKISSNNIIFQKLQSIKVYFCLCLSWIFVKAINVDHALGILQNIFSFENFDVIVNSIKAYYYIFIKIINVLLNQNNSSIPFNIFYEQILNKTIFIYGIGIPDSIILLFSLAIIIIVGIMHNHNIEIRTNYNKSNFFIKSTLLILFIFVIIIFGAYGPTYNPSDFIYRNF